MRNWGEWWSNGVVEGEAPRRANEEWVLRC